MLRQRLHEQAVAEADAQVPPSIASQVAGLKAALADAAQAAFACAKPSASPDELQAILAEALHANLPEAAATFVETRNNKDGGAYGSDLAVQVFPLTPSPKYFEVDFRFGIECGDDNLLQVFTTAKAPEGTSAEAWHELLRWGAAGYTNVSGAYGDFVMMTPLSGFAARRNWRFVVAHGQPGCGAETGPSHFALDVLEPGVDPAQPRVVWHLEHPYRRGEVPRLSTTEDTLTFELITPRKTEKAAKVPAHTDTFRYRIGRDNQVEPLLASENTGQPAAVVSTSSPR